MIWNWIEIWMILNSHVILDIRQFHRLDWLKWWRLERLVRLAGLRTLLGWYSLEGLPGLWSNNVKYIKLFLLQYLLMKNIRLIRTLQLFGIQLLYQTIWRVTAKERINTRTKPVISCNVLNFWQILFDSREKRELWDVIICSFFLLNIFFHFVFAPNISMAMASNE